jgi:hypothetical protein
LGKRSAHWREIKRSCKRKKENLLAVATIPGSPDAIIMGLVATLMGTDNQNPLHMTGFSVIIGSDRLVLSEPIFEGHKRRRFRRIGNET